MIFKNSLLTQPIIELCWLPIYLWYTHMHMQFFWWYMISEIMIFFCSLRRLTTPIIAKIGSRGEMSEMQKCHVFINGKSIYFVIYQPCVYCTLLIAEAMIDWLTRLRKKYNLNTYCKFRGLYFSIYVYVF